MGSPSTSASPISPFHRLCHGSPHHHHPIHALQSPRLRPGSGLHGQHSFVQRRQEQHSWASTSTTTTRTITRTGEMNNVSPQSHTMSLQQTQSILQLGLLQDFHDQEPQPRSQSRSYSEPLSTAAATSSQPITSQPSSPACSLVPPPSSDYTGSDTQASTLKAARAKLSTTKLRALLVSRRSHSHSHSSQNSNDSARQRQRSSSPSPLAATNEVAPIPEEPSAQPEPDLPRAPPVAEPRIGLEPAPVQHASRPVPARDATNVSPSNKRRNSTRGDSGEPQASPTTLKKQRPEVQPPKPVPIQYSTCPVDDLVVLIAHMIEELIQTNDALALSSGSLTRFHSRTAPGISVLEYLRRLARHATLTQPILLSMVYYIDRLCAMYPEFTINTLTVHRFLITAGTVAAKGLLDSYWTNATYARVGGVRLAELKLLELEFLYRVDWRIIPNPEVLVAYYQGLVGRHPEYVMEEEEEAAAVEDDDEEDMFDDSDDGGVEVEGHEQGVAKEGMGASGL